jgi:putative DNA primase/helicase
MDASKVAREILSRARYISVPVLGSSGLKPNYRIYRYNSLGYYEDGGRAEILSMVQEIKGDKASLRFCNEVLGHIERLTTVEADVLNPDGYLNVANGIVDLESRKLLPHSPDWYFTKQVPIVYHPKARCELFEKFLSEVVDGPYTVLVKELLGFIFMERYKFHRAFILVGSGRNGKTTFLQVVKALLGDRWAAVPLQDLCENRFAVASLQGCLANICDDMPVTAVKYSGKLKMLCGESPITIERKYEDMRNFENKAKLIFACNKIPPALDADDAYFERWVIIPFPNKFTGANCDPNLVEKLTAPYELAGVLNLALDMKNKLETQNDFTIPDDGLTPRARYNQYIGGETTLVFLAKHLRQDPASMASKKEIYTAYLDYCDMMEEIPKDPRALFRALYETYPLAEEARIRTASTTERLIKNIRLEYDRSAARRYFLTDEDIE